MIQWLLPTRLLIVAGVLAAVAIGIPILKHRYDASQQRIGYDRRAAEDKAATDAQIARIRDLQRAAELRYTVTAQGQTRYITRIIQEVQDAAASLAACPVPADAVRLLNDAAACARGDSPAACRAGDRVSGAR